MILTFSILSPPENLCGLNLTDVLAFVTRATFIPPMGFPRQVSIMFIYDTSKKLPGASTCSLVLRLPVALRDAEEFKERMEFAIKNSVGFGMV